MRRLFSEECDMNQSQSMRVLIRVVAFPRLGLASRQTGMSSCTARPRVSMFEAHSETQTLAWRPGHVSLTDVIQQCLEACWSLIGQPATRIPNRAYSNGELLDFASISSTTMKFVALLPNGSTSPINRARCEFWTPGATIRRPR